MRQGHTFAYNFRYMLFSTCMSHTLTMGWRGRGVGEWRQAGREEGVTLA